MDFNLIYGTAWKKQSTKACVLQAFNVGFRAFDTACQPKHYNEPLVGEALKELFDAGVDRNSVYIQTKFTPLDSQDPNRIPYDASASLAEQVEQSFAASIENLHCDWLDAWVLHSPLNKKDELMGVWSAMEKVYDTGGARRLGISNCYDLGTLRFLVNQARIPPCIVQNRFYAQTGFDREIRRFCAEQAIQYQSFWTLTANAQLLESQPLLNIAGRLRKTQEQVLFRYLHQRGVVPLTGTTDTVHMQQDLAISQFELTSDDLAAIDRKLDLLS